MTLMYLFVAGVEYRQAVAEDAYEAWRRAETAEEKARARDTLESAGAWYDEERGAWWWFVSGVKEGAVVRVRELVAD